MASMEAKQAAPALGSGAQEQGSAASLFAGNGKDETQHAGPSQARSMILQQQQGANERRALMAAEEQARTFIYEGDLIIVFLSRDRPPLPITVTPGLAVANAYGTFSHGDMIGMPFGAKLASRNKRGFIHLLRPTPELWTIALPHRTQILYSPDMSFIAANLGLSPGGRVIEAGTGSGSFSHYATRCVARKHLQSSGRGWRGPREDVTKTQSDGKKSGAQRRRDMKRKQQAVNTGATSDSSSDDDSDAEGTGVRTNGDDESDKELEQKTPANDKEARVLQELASAPNASVGERDGRLWSYEFHAGRAAKAWYEFEDHGLFPTLSLRHRNVVKSGFGLKDAADAVFLDLPAPWQALHHAAVALRRDTATRICCFSPCVEQVLKTVAALRRGTRDEDGGTEGGHEDGTAERAAWTDIETYECLQRTHVSVWTGPGSLVPTARIDEAILRIRHTEEKKARRRLLQIERTRREREARQKGQDSKEVGNAQTSANAAAGEKRKRDAFGESEAEEDDNDTPDGIEVGDGKATIQSKSVLPRHPANNGNFLPDSRTLTTRDGKTLHRANVYARPFPDMRGHTSYLTFATLPPRVVVQAADPTLERERQQEQRKAIQAERVRARQEARRREQEAADPAATATEKVGQPVASDVVSMID